MQGLRDALNGAEITADMVAPSTLGEKCWVRWPYLQVRFPRNHSPGFRPCQVAATCRGHRLPEKDDPASHNAVALVVHR